MKAKSMKQPKLVIGAPVVATFDHAMSGSVEPKPRSNTIITDNVDAADAAEKFAPVGLPEIQRPAGASETPVAAGDSEGTAAVDVPLAFNPAAASYPDLTAAASTLPVSTRAADKAALAPATNGSSGSEDGVADSVASASAKDGKTEPSREDITATIPTSRQEDDAVGSTAVRRPDWLRLELDRATAAEYLGDVQVAPGKFVVRSGSKKQEWAVSIVQDGKVVHYRIRYVLATGEEDDAGYAVPSGLSSTPPFKDFQLVNKEEFAPRKFATIDEFVAHYARYPIATGIAEGGLLDVAASAKLVSKAAKRTKARGRLEALRDAEKQGLRQTVYGGPEVAHQGGDASPIDSVRRNSR